MIYSTLTVISDISKSLVIMNEKQFITHTREIYSSVMNFLTGILLDIEYVALTFDVIIAKDVNIFVITAHWVKKIFTLSALKFF